MVSLSWVPVYTTVFGYITVGQIVVRGPVAEAELQHPHARQIELLAKCIHFTGDQAEILGNQRQLA